MIALLFILGVTQYRSLMTPSNCGNIFQTLKLNLYVIRSLGRWEGVYCFDYALLLMGLKKKKWRSVFVYTPRFIQDALLIIFEFWIGRILSMKPFRRVRIQSSSRWSMESKRNVSLTAGRIWQPTWRFRQEVASLLCAKNLLRFRRKSWTMVRTHLRLQHVIYLLM